VLPPVLPPAPPTSHRIARADRGDKSPLSTQGMKIRYSTKFDGDRILVVLDNDESDWHVDAGPGYSSTQMGALLERIYSMGYKAMPESECGSELLSDGSVRIYLVPVA
jgi:hypothetical protein